MWSYGNAVVVGCHVVAVASELSQSNEATQMVADALNKLNVQLECNRMVREEFKRCVHCTCINVYNYIIPVLFVTYAAVRRTGTFSKL